MVVPGRTDPSGDRHGGAAPPSDHGAQGRLGRAAPSRGQPARGGGGRPRPPRRPRRPRATQAARSAGRPPRSRPALPRTRAGWPRSRLSGTATRSMTGSCAWSRSWSIRTGKGIRRPSTGAPTGPGRPPPPPRRGRPWPTISGCRSFSLPPTSPTTRPRAGDRSSGPGSPVSPTCRPSLASLGPGGSAPHASSLPLFTNRLGITFRWISSVRTTVRTAWRSEPPPGSVSAIAARRRRGPKVPERTRPTDHT